MDLSRVPNQITQEMLISNHLEVYNVKKDKRIGRVLYFNNETKAAEMYVTKKDEKTGRHSIVMENGKPKTKILWLKGCILRNLQTGAKHGEV